MLQKYIFTNFIRRWNWKYIFMTNNTFFANQIEDLNTRARLIFPPRGTIQNEDVETCAWLINLDWGFAVKSMIHSMLRVKNTDVDLKRCRHVVHYNLLGLIMAIISWLCVQKIDLSKKLVFDFFSKLLWYAKKINVWIHALSLKLWTSSILIKMVRICQFFDMLKIHKNIVGCCDINMNF